MGKNKINCAFVLTLMMLTIKTSAQVRDPSGDSRVALTQLESTPEQAGVMFVFTDGIRQSFGPLASRTFSITNAIFGPRVGLCEDEIFANTPSALGGFCSGTLVAPNIVLTAAHCVDDKKCEDISALVGITAANIEDKLPAKDHLYKCTRVHYNEDCNISLARGSATHMADNSYSQVQTEQCGNQSDWALVVLERSVLNATPVALQTERLEVGDRLIGVGNPNGIPNIQSMGTVKHVLEDGSGVGTTLTYFGGNSGGGVFNKKGELVGVAATSWGVQRGEFFAEPSGCLRWRSDEGIRELEFYQDDGTLWPTGGGVVPTSNFYDKIFPYLTEFDGSNPAVNAPIRIQESSGVE